MTTEAAPGSNEQQQQPTQTPEQIKERLISALTEDTQPAEPAQQQPAQQQQQQPDNKTAPPIVPTFSPVWNDLAKKLSTEEKPWEIPTHIKEGKFGEGRTELDHILEVIYQNTDFSTLKGYGDPLVQEYIAAASQPDFDSNAWIRSKSAESSIGDKKGKEFLKAYYSRYKLKSDQNPDGYTQEEIDTYLNSKNIIEIDKEADITKRMWTEAETVKANERKTADKAKADKAFDDQEEANLKAINTFIQGSQGAKDFMGIEFSEAEKAQFFKDLPEMFKRDPSTRLSRMDKLMQSEEVLKVAALLWKGEAAVRGQQSQARQDVKTEIENKLGLSQQRAEGSVVTPRGEFNPANLV